MYKTLIVFFLFCQFIFLNAAESSQKIEIIAKDINATQTEISTTKGVVVYYKDSVIKANHARYNKKEKKLILDGNVESIGYKGTKEHTQHMEIQTEDNIVQFRKLFLTNENDIWMYTQKADRKKDVYRLGETMLSSCDIDDPLWHMRFSHSLYDAKDNYMKIYGAKIYFKNVPIFYFPYLAFSTSRERSSGLLFPLFGYSSEEGFVYEQPFFWAIDPSIDLEINPQIRTKRSIGAYATLRFVDSDHSSGELRVGYFKDKSSYAKKHRLNEDSHYGVEFNYQASHFFTNILESKYKDGLYINSTYLNDIDYLNLQKTNLQHFGLVPIQESRLNYFIYNDEYYGGINTKYFIDTRRKHNDETLQVLPAVQLHKYLQTFLFKNLTYNIDAQMKNLHRKKGLTLKQLELKVPLEYTHSFLNNYLNLSFGEDIQYSVYSFGNGEYQHKNFTYFATIHKAKLFTDLTKRYGEFIHVMQPSLEYKNPGVSEESPVAYSALTDEQHSLFNVALPEEEYALSISNYIYDMDAKLKFYQRLSQKYYPKRIDKFTDVTNEMLYKLNNWTLYSNLVYVPQFNKLREASTMVSLRDAEYQFRISHTYKKVLDDQPAARTANDINLQMNYSLNDHVNLGAGLTYDIDESSSRQWSIGGSYHRDCWSMDASIRQDIIPRPTGFSKNNTFYLQLNFIPFGGIGTNSFQQ